MNNSLRKDFLWNALAGIINAAEAVVMSMVVTRLGRLSDAGILSLAFASGNVLMTIGKYGGRIYQVTDAKGQFSFKLYVIQRFCTIGLMSLSLMLYILIAQYETRKALVILIIAFIYIVETLEDCLWGNLQTMNKLYVGAQMFVSRWIAILMVFTICMLRTNDIVSSLSYALIGGVSVFLIWIVGLSKRNAIVNPRGDSYEDRGNLSPLSGLQGLFRETTPLFLASFCSILISNMPKFSIDRYMNDESQACYGFVAMPVFVIGLLNQFIYQPTVVRLAKEYDDGDIVRFQQSVRRQIIIVTMISALCILGAGTVGIPVLSFIYHTDLTGYGEELIILQIAGGFLALAGYYSVLLTIMRRQRLILYGYIAATAAGIALLSIAVKHEGTLGAAVGYLFVIIMLFTYYLVIYHKSIGSYTGRG